jgi:polyisoprenoid-binding protein YceI
VRLGRSADGFEGLFRLRIRDVERDVTIPFAFEGDGSHGMISGELTLDRLDYDVGERSIILSDEVRVTVSARLRRSG